MAKRKKMDPQDGLILMALPEESQGLCESVAKSFGVHLHFTDVGKSNATQKGQDFMRQHKPKWVLNLGVAGSRSIDQSLVECVRITQKTDAFPDFVQHVYELSPITKLSPVFCGSEDFVDSKKPRLQCDIFEREAYALAYLCERFNITFNSIKYVNKVTGSDVVKEWYRNLDQAAVSLSEQLKKILGQN